MNVLKYDGLIEYKNVEPFGNIRVVEIEGELYFSLTDIFRMYKTSSQQYQVSAHVLDKFKFMVRGKHVWGGMLATNVQGIYYLCKTNDEPAFDELRKKFGITKAVVTADNLYLLDNEKVEFAYDASLIQTQWDR